MNKFRLLRPDEIECRIGAVKGKSNKGPGGVSLLLYKTARTDANLLDETVGPENWVNDFKLIDGVLYGGIGIYNAAKDSWVWKWDAGTESNTEAEKGRASDAFKRAGYKHGIGRELYTSPFIWVSGDDCRITEDGRPKCYDTFTVTEISYDNKGNIIVLAIINDKTHRQVFYLGKHKNTPQQQNPQQTASEAQKQAPKPQAAPDGNYYCEDCGLQIAGVNYEGKDRTPRAVAARALQNHGRQLCWDCQQRHDQMQTG